ncbi:MAG: cysteine desulfurase NifS [Clostridia bacterium]|nr:cysteine desulfurase NifS [Clostridia bacterium]
MEKITSVYLDNAATTPLSSEVYKEMLTALSDTYGNASSMYQKGREADEALSEARSKVAKAIGANPSEIYFTSCGSESNNWAIKGIARANKSKGNHIITSAIEHPSVLESCKALEKEGFEVTYIPVDSKGVVDYTEIVKAIKPETILISIMSANNEVGTIQPIRAISELAKMNEIPFHTDAVQAIGTIPFNVHEMNITSLSLSAHKFGGPKGIGVLYVKRGTKIEKFIDGGQQERNLRAGTSNVPAAVGLGKAIEIAVENLEENNKKLKAIRKYFLKEVSDRIHNISLNGHPTQRLLNNVNISFEGVEGEALLMMLDRSGVYVSTGSACASGSLEPSHVLLAMGLDNEIAQSSIRFTFSPNTTTAEIDYAVNALYKAVKKVRSISAIRIYKNKVEL